MQNNQFSSVVQLPCEWAIFTDLLIVLLLKQLLEKLQAEVYVLDSGYQQLSALSKLITDHLRQISQNVAID